VTQGRRAAVLGSPVAHSLSPVLHTAAYAALGLTGWRYDRIECREDALAGLVAGLGPDWVGLSLTMPLKRVALDVADEVTPLARAVGAANTLLLDGTRRAHNTDVAGIVGALGEAGMDRAGSAVVLGAGGTARAALAALRDLGVNRPLVLVRDPARAADLEEAAERLGVRPEVRAGLLDGPLPAADVVVSTLPAGAADPLARQPWRGRPVVLDAVYAGWPTPLAASAAAAGCTVVGGLAVLLHQAVEQVRLMTGRPAPVAAMRAALPPAGSVAG
jgi:shikimate dehydrogenase